MGRKAHELSGNLTVAGGGVVSSVAMKANRSVGARQFATDCLCSGAACHTGALCRLINRQHLRECEGCISPLR